MVTFNTYKSDFTEYTLAPYIYVGLIIISLWLTLVSIILIVTSRAKLRSLRETIQQLKDKGLNNNLNPDRNELTNSLEAESSHNIDTDLPPQSVAQQTEVSVQTDSTAVSTDKEIESADG